MYKKMRLYLPVLAILWLGAFTQGIASEIEEYKKVSVIEAIQNSNDAKQILLEKEVYGKMSLLEMELEAENLLTAYQGQIVKSLYGENFYSFYGFSEQIEDFIISEGEKINLNLVITYDEENDVTHVVWATPFLNEDF